MLLWACYLHAFAAVMAVGGIMYWVQFHYKMGPVAINISRILLDVVTNQTTATLPPSIEQQSWNLTKHG